MTTTTYSTPGTYTFVVPAQCTSISLDVSGAGGATRQATSAIQPKNMSGERILATLAVTPGDTYTFVVGARGGQAAVSGTQGGVGGFNGGGAGGSVSGANGHSGHAGGGGTDIRHGGTGLAQRILVAGGGGGDGGDFTASAAGAAAGGTTTGARGAPMLPYGGSGGSQSAGGAAGSPIGSAADNAQAGSLGQGGHGSTHAAAANYAGGGGGGGYYGGGGGGGSDSRDSISGGASQGGGGSGYVSASFTSVTRTQGGGAPPNQDGYVKVTFNSPPSAPTLSSPAAPTAAGAGSFAHDSSIDIVLAHNDPEAGAMSRMDYRYRVGSGAWTEVDHPAFVNVSGTTYKTTVAAGTFDTFLDQAVEFQARTYDPLSAVSPWSMSKFAIPRNAPTAAVITSPTAGPIASTSPSLSWTTVAGMVAYQFAAYQQDGTLISMSGIALPSGAPTSETASFHALPLVDHADYHFAVRWQQYSGVWSPWATTADFEAVVSAPLQPTLDLTALPDTASIKIDITNPGSDPHPPVSNRLYRSDLDRPDEPEILIARDVSVNGSFTDASPAARHTYRYRAEAVTATGSFTSSQ